MAGREVDALDRRVIQALQIDGRASSTALAAALQVSDRTVARRIARLRSTGVVRVVGSLDERAAGRPPWLLRVRTTPGAARAVAMALARRRDTTWVRVLAAGSEVVCTVQDAGATASSDLLAEVLPRSPSVLEATAQQQLHVYRRGTRSLAYLADGLTPAQRSAVEQGASPRGARADEDGPGPARLRRPLDEVDSALLSVLRRDGRAPVEVLASATSTPTSTVSRRLHRMRASGALRLDVEVDHAALGRPVLTHLWMAVAPGQLQSAGAALREHPEVAFAAATTGRTNLYACVLAADASGLHDYLTGRLAAVRDVEVLPVAAHLKGADATGRDRAHRGPHDRQPAAVSAANSR